MLPFFCVLRNGNIGHPAPYHAWRKNDFPLLPYAPAALRKGQHGVVIRQLAAGRQHQSRWMLDIVAVIFSQNKF